MKDLKQDSLNEYLKILVAKGCFPCVSYRGPKVWRAHINRTGNFWEDDTTPLKAMIAAIKLWEKAGCPLDGAAI